MKKSDIIFSIAFLLFLSSPLFSNPIISLKWGEAPHNINYYTVPEGRYGISVFYKDYNDHIWTANSCNVRTTTCTDWCNKTKTIKSPSWVVVGTNSRFPYSWGGFSTISQFDQGLAY